MKYLLILLSCLLISCGARKVDKSKQSEKEEIHTSIDEQKKVQEIEQERKQLWELIYTSVFKADSIVQKDGVTKIYKPTIEAETKETKQDESKDTTKTEETDLNKKVEERKEIKEITKQSDRKQFNFVPILILVVFLLSVLFYFRKKITLIIKRLL